MRPTSFSLSFSYKDSDDIGSKSPLELGTNSTFSDEVRHQLTVLTREYESILASQGYLTP